MTTEAQEQPKAARAFVLFLVAGAAIYALLRYGRIPQPEDYHAFADTRKMGGIPNALNVLSNAPFAAVALWASTSANDGPPAAGFRNGGDRFRSGYDRVGIRCPVPGCPQYKRRRSAHRSSMPAGLSEISPARRT